MRERVEAAQVRPGDTLLTDDGPLFVHDVDRRRDRVRLLTNGAWWTVRVTTRFVRAQRSRRINTRPDLDTRTRD